MSPDVEKRPSTPGTESDRGMNVEPILTLLADEHRRFLWREQRAGWGFATGHVGTPHMVFPTLEEAIEDEIESLKRRQEEAHRALDHAREKAKTLDRHLAALLAARRST